jgi:hypothetical protein
MQIHSTQRLLGSALILLAGSAGLWQTAWASDYPVGCGVNAANDLATAISTAVTSSGNSVTLSSGCTYTMSWDGTTKASDGSPTVFARVGKALTINGRGATIALAGSSQPARFFYINSAGALTLNSLTLSGGIARGADGANAPPTGDSSASGGMYSGLGGAIYNAGSLVATDSTFDSNQAIGGNGGCAVNGGTSGAGGAGIGGAIFSIAANLSIRRSTFVNNSATGGHARAYGDSACTFTSNAAGGGGGGMGGNGAYYVFSGPSQAGTAGGYGGGGGGAMFLVSNSGGNGGFGGGAGGPNAVPGEFGSLAAVGNFSGGTGAGLGGALFIESVAGTAQVVNSTFSANTAHGGDANYFGASNGASGAGGAVFVHNGALTLIADTIANNTASGGNVSNAANAQNGGDGVGAGIYVHSGATLNLALTIVTGGSATAGTSTNGNSGSASDPDVSGTITSGGYNLVTTRGGSAGYVGTDLNDGTAANLGTLTNNGGATQTLLPNVGSAAIDAAPPSACNNLGSDQRGAPRPNGAGCDIGAVETGDYIFRDGFEGGSDAGVVQCGGIAGYSNALIDTFPGPTLGANWTQNTNGGTVTVNNGASLMSIAPQFPFVTATGSPIPASGDFSVRWLATYTNLSGQGTGTLVLSNGLPANNATDNYALRSADAWQDTQNGFTVRVRTNASTYNSVVTTSAQQNVAHDIEYCWIGSNIEVWVDGVRKLVAPNAGLTRPTTLWFGNPVNASSGGTAWSSFKFDHVYVRSVTP